MSVQNLHMKAPQSAPAPDVLRSTLRAASLRIRALILLRLGSHALCGSALVSLAAVGLSKAHLWPEPSPWITGGLIVLAVAAAAAYALSRRLSDLEVARLTDRRTDLKERLSSAVEFHALGLAASGTDSFYQEQMSDALRHATGLKLSEAYPARLPRTLWVGIVASLAVFGMYFLPTMPIFWNKQKQQEMAEVKKQGIAIVKVAQDSEKTANQQDLKETKKAAAEARKLGEAMQKAKMGKKEALVSMQKLTRKMEEAQQKLADQQSRQMEKAKQAGADFKKSMEQMQKEVEAKRRENEARKADLAKTPMQKSGEKTSAQSQKEQQAQQSQASKQAMQAMQQMADALANMDKQQQEKAMQKIADALKSGKLSKEEMKQLQQAVKQLAKSLEQSGQKEQADQMSQLAEQMQDGANTMDPQTLQNLAQMAQNIGKNMKGKGGKMDKDALDEQKLAQLAEMLKDGRMTMAMGKNAGQGGPMPGSGFNGKGHLTSPMKDPNATSPRLIAEGKPGAAKGIGKTKSAEEFARYAAMKNAPPKFLPNAQNKGVRSKEGQELQQNFTGDPEAFRSNTPYFQAYVSGRKQAESSLNKENIPVAYKKQVRDYFDSIKP